MKMFKSKLCIRLIVDEIYRHLWSRADRSIESIHRIIMNLDVSRVRRIVALFSELSFS